LKELYLSSKNQLKKKKIEISYQLSDIDIFPEISWICLRNSLSMKLSVLKTVSTDSAWVYPPKTRMQFKAAIMDKSKSLQRRYCVGNIPVARMIGSALGADNLTSLIHYKQCVRSHWPASEIKKTNLFGGYHQFADFEKAVSFEIIQNLA